MPQIKLTDKWLGLPPIMTDPAIGVIRRPRSLVAHVPDRLAQWAIAQGLAIAADDKPAPETPSAAPEIVPPSPADELVLSLVNDADAQILIDIRGISEKVAGDMVAARPLTLDALRSLLSSRQLQTLYRYVEDAEDG